MNEQLRAVITGVIQKGTVLHGVSLMSPADRLEAHEKQMVANLVAAIEPLIERDALDHPEERAFADIEARLNIHADQIIGIQRRLDASDARHNASIHRDKTINNAIERLERSPNVAIRLVRRLNMDDSIVEIGSARVLVSKIEKLTYTDDDHTLMLAGGTLRSFHNDDHVLIIEGKATP